MKIDSTGRVRTTPVKKGERSARAGRAGAFADHLEPTEAGTSIARSAPVHTVDAVLAIQEVPDATAQPGNARARQWGMDTLDQLEQVRLDLLLGAIPKGRLLAIARMVNARKAGVEDPQLRAILDDIELRARVEIAKYEPRR